MDMTWRDDEAAAMRCTINADGGSDICRRRWLLKLSSCRQLELGFSRWLSVRSARFFERNFAANLVADPIKRLKTISANFEQTYSPLERFSYAQGSVMNWKTATRCSISRFVCMTPLRDYEMSNDVIYRYRNVWQDRYLLQHNSKGSRLW